MRLPRFRPGPPRHPSLPVDTLVRGEPAVHNLGRIDIGAGVRIDSSPCLTHLATGPAGVIEIGDRVVIGQGVALAAEGLVTIGDDVTLGSFVMIMDSDFHVAGDREAAPAPEPVSIGARSTIGHRSVVLPGARIGSGVVVEPASVVAGAVPDGARVRGNPAMPVSSGANEGIGSVAGVIRTVLGLDADPDPGAGPDDIAGWDSLGALRVLIAIEAEFGILLGDSTLAEARTVRELDDLVDTARRRASSVDADASDAGNRPW